MHKSQLVQIMGILNVTPNSFADGGRFSTLDKAVRQAELMLKEGADIIDVGGEATSPGAKAVSLQEELDRVLPVIEKIKAELDIFISVDTNKPEVMQAAINAGAHIINDIYALQKPGAIKAVASNNVKICLMHMQGEPETMQNNPSYKDVTTEVYDFLKARIDVCIKAGIDRKRLIIDPGFGFGKTVQHNLKLIRDLRTFEKLSCPILVGASRKSTIGAILNKPVEERLYGSLALHTIAILHGASIIRTHDVAATQDIYKIIKAMEEV